MSVLSTGLLGVGLDVAAPAALWGLLLVVPLVALHLYRRRRVVVPFLPLLVEALGRDRPGGGWRRLRETVSLVLRVLAVVAGVLALAGLVPARAAPPPAALVLVVDAGVTAGAVEPDGATRYEHAVTLARAVVRSAAWREVTVVEARDAPEVVVAPTASSSAAAERLAQLLVEVGAGRRPVARTPADLDGALRLAFDRAAADDDVRVLLLSAAPLPATFDATPGLEAWGTGSTRDDQGLTAFDVSRDPDGATYVDVRVRNDDETPRRRDLVVQVAGTEVARRTLALEPGAEQEAHVELELPRAGAYVWTVLDGQDAFPANDRAVAWVVPPLRPTVLVVHGRTLRPYTRAVLEAMEDTIDVEGSGAVDVADLERMAPGEAQYDVVVVDGVELPPASLRPGAWIFLAPLSGTLPFDVGAPLTRPLVWRTRPDHPLVRDLSLADAYVVRGYPVSGVGLTPLAEADGRAILAEGEREGVRYVVLGLDPEASDLPLRAALPLLVRGAVRRLTERPAAPLAPYYRAGDRLRPRLDLPGGPGARILWAGGSADADLAPDAQGFSVPRGASLEVEVQTGQGAAAWTGRTAFLDLDPQQSIVPARPEAAVPAPARAAVPEEDRWRRALLTTALILLLIDVLVLARRGRPATRPV